MRLLVLVCLVLVALDGLSVPAYPKRIAFQLENGNEVFISIRGDETRKWAISEDEYTLLPERDGWVYAQEDENGYAVPSSFRLVAEKDKDALTKDFLKSQKKRLPLRMHEELYNQTNKSVLPVRAIPPSVTGSRTALVILMEFKDCPFKKEKADFEALFNEAGYHEDGAVGSVYDYFTWASHGQLQFYCDILGPFKTERPMKYYGENSLLSSGGDANPYELFREAIDHASSQVDLSEYDSNGDGFVDNVHIIFSGYGEEAGASSSAIWSHEMMFEPIMVQDMVIDRYSCAPELRGNKGNGISRIGPHCHEMGHALGAMDYYDTDYEKDGSFEGTGMWDIMAQGSWNNEGVSPANFNPYVRIYNFGWEEANLLPTDGYAVLEPSNESKGHIYRIDTPVDGEFFLIENRAQSSFDASLPDKGLNIYHIGAGLEEKAPKNRTNASYPQECYLVCASSKYDVPTAEGASYGEINAAGATFPGATGNREFNDSSTPSARCQNGSESGVSLSEITLREDGCISLFNGTLPEPETWWEEGFETPSSFTHWEIEDGLVGEYSFYTSKETGSILNPFFQLPEPPEGNDFFYVSNRDASLYKGRIVSEWIPCQLFNSYVLSYVYHITSRTIMQENDLSVYFRKSNDAQWALLAKHTAITRDWEKHKVDLPFSLGKFQLAFEFNVKSLSAICLDGVKVGVKSSPDGVEETEALHTGNADLKIRQSGGICWIQSLAGENQVQIYDLSGRIRFGAGMGYMEEIPLRLPVGIYVIRTKDAVRKLIVR